MRKVLLRFFVLLDDTDDAHERGADVEVDDEGNRGSGYSHVVSTWYGLKFISLLGVGNFLNLLNP